MASTLCSIREYSAEINHGCRGRKEVDDAVVLIFSYEIKEEEDCFCLGFDKER